MAIPYYYKKKLELSDDREYFDEVRKRSLENNERTRQWYINKYRNDGLGNEEVLYYKQHTYYIGNTKDNDIREFKVNRPYTINDAVSDSLKQRKKNFEEKYKNKGKDKL